ncbi:MAG: T9SS type A sorting domain-containing protein, partial [Bacteroidales bacterium]
ERTSGGTVYVDNIQFVGGWTYVREAFGAEINVYPNPTAEELTVKYPQIEGVTISNITGQMVRMLEYQQVDYTRINVEDLEPGVYFLTVDSPHGKVSSKFVKR